MSPPPSIVPACTYLWKISSRLFYSSFEVPALLVLPVVPHVVYFSQGLLFSLNAAFLLVLIRFFFFRVTLICRWTLKLLRPCIIYAFDFKRRPCLPSVDPHSQQARCFSKLPPPFSLPGKSRFFMSRASLLGGGLIFDVAARPQLFFVAGPWQVEWSAAYHPPWYKASPSLGWCFRCVRFHSHDFRRGFSNLRF